MSHCLSPDEIVDVVDGTLPADRRAHLATCSACRHAVDEVRDALALAADAEVPEPPAAFWPALNARVHAAIAAVEAERTWRTGWRWDVVLPLAGLALVVMALASAIDGATARRGNDAAADLAGIEALPADALPDDDALALVEDLAASLPEGGWDALGVTRLPDLDIAAAALSADEQAALAALLQAAVERPKS